MNKTEDRKAYYRDYYIKNREKLLEYQRHYKEAHRERYRRKKAERDNDNYAG